MQATFRIKASELDYSFIKKLKKAFKDEILEIKIDTDYRFVEKVELEK